MYRLSEHSLAVEKGRHRQSCSQRRRDSAPTVTDNKSRQNCTSSCPKYRALRNEHFPKIIKIHPEFEHTTDMDKLPYLLGEMPKCDNIAAKFIILCHNLRTASGTWETQFRNNFNINFHNLYACHRLRDRKWYTYLLFVVFIFFDNRLRVWTITCLLLF